MDWPLLPLLLLLAAARFPLATARFPLATALLLLTAAQGAQAQVVNVGDAQCCSSRAPEKPPATYYGATVFRDDDPRSAWQPYLAPPDDPPAETEAILTTIEARETAGGPMAADLPEALGGLGAAYLAKGRYTDGIAALRRGIHVARVNEGLYTPSQTAMLEQLIRAHVIQGDFVAADEQQSYLYRVRSRELDPTSPEMLQTTMRYADWVRGAYLGDLGRERFPRLMVLNDLYRDAIQQLEEAEGEDSPKLLPYLQGRIELSYLISVYPGEDVNGYRGDARQVGDVSLPNEAQVRFWRLQDYNFRYGLDALEQRERIIRNDPEHSAEEIANARLAIADWHQWHRRFAEAIRHYKDAWAIMAEAQGGERWLRERLSQPLELPQETVFNPGAIPLKISNTAEISVRFDVNRHGEAKGIDFLTPRSEETEPAITRAYHYLRNMRFRPRLTDGVVVEAQNMQRTYRIRF